MGYTTNVVQLEIDGHWTAEEMATMLLHFRDLYDLDLVLKEVSSDWRHVAQRVQEVTHLTPSHSKLKGWLVHPKMPDWSVSSTPLIPSDPEQLSLLLSLLYPEAPLRVSKIQYGSRGSIDLLGVSEALGHIKDLILKPLDYIMTRRQRELENKGRELKNEETELGLQRLRIQNATDFVRLAKEMGYSKAQIRRLANFSDLRQATFINHIKTNKIRGIK